MLLGPIVGLLGTAVSAYGTIAGSRAQAASLDYQAKVARQKGAQEEASAQRQALDTARKTQLAQSTLQARAAGSGAGASDPTVIDLASDIAGRGKYQGLLQQSEGAFKNWDYQTEAAGKEASASAYRDYGTLSAAGTLLGGVGNTFKSYSNGMFSGTTLPSSQTAFSLKPADDNYWDRWGLNYGYIG